jgi:drug/metabolite transporter (DMT)-like permease
MFFDGISFILLVNLVHGQVLWRNIWQDRLYTLVSGLLGICTFSVFIWALRFGSVGEVSALRETSILFSSLIGIFYLKEKWSWQRLAAAFMIMIGISIFVIFNT